MIKISKVIQLLSLATIIGFSSCKKETVDPQIPNKVNPGNSVSSSTPSSGQGDTTALRRHQNNPSSPGKPTIDSTTKHPTTSAPPVVTSPVVTPPVISTPPVTKPPVTTPVPPVVTPPVVTPPVVSTPPVTKPPVTTPIPPVVTPPVVTPPVVSTPPVTKPPVTTPVPPVVTPPVVVPSTTPVISRSSFISVTGIPVYKENAGNNAFFYQTGMTIDADGAYKCYHANSSIALSNLEMAGYPGNWWALVTDNNGEPVIQGPNDPAPGYYIAQTSLENQSLARTDPHRYVDALTIPYIVLPPQLQNAGNARLGDFAAVYNKNNNMITYAIFADQGPETHIGEASVAAAHNVGLELVNKEGGADNGIIYIVFPGSGNGAVRTVSEINSQGAALLNSWGGIQKLKAAF